MIDLDTLELDNAKAYELLARGDTLGVFQLDGGSMRDLLRRMVPTTFEDISAVLALYRPGPMGANAHNDYADRKNGRQEVRPIHAELAEPLADILDETFVVSYWTAYLKANHRSEYMAALLTSVGDDKDKAAVYLAECRKMGITVLPPDVNSSKRDFTAVGDDIRFGLGAIRNVGGNVVDAITWARAEKGGYTDFSDFLRKVDAVACNRKVVESLIKAGAFDSLGHPRKGLHLVHGEAIGQFDLFGSRPGDGACAGLFDVPVPPDQWDTKLQLALEREMLGLYVSGHPLRGVEHILARQSDTPIASILDGSVADGAQVIVGGILASVTRWVNRNGEPWAAAQLEDLAAGIEVLFSPRPTRWSG